MPTDRRLRAILLAAALPACVLAGQATAGAAAMPTLGAAAAVTTDGAAAKGVPEQVLVRFRPGTDADERRSARRAADADFVEPLPLAGLQLVDPEPGTTVRETVAELERSPDVLYAEPDAARTAAATPDDDFFDLQWGLHNTGQTVNGRAGLPDADIDAPEAWELTTGSADVPVAVVDTGVDATHPDLAPNVRSGPDFVDGDNTPDDLDGHGTHVAGTIAARGNDGFGVTGVAWNAGIVPVRVLDENGDGFVSDVVKGYAYARDNGIPIVNASLGGAAFSQPERDALASAPNVLFVVAAGNGDQNGNGLDNDQNGSYPCNYDLSNVVCVAASGQSDALASFSNYGSTTVDLAAPGTNVYSTCPAFSGYCEPDWDYLNGTSMATPHVAGVAALVRSLRPRFTVANLRAALLEAVDVKSSLIGRTASGGRLNAARALRYVPPSTASAPPPATTAPAAPAPAPTASPAPAPATAPAEPADTVDTVATTATHRPRSFRVLNGRLVRGRGALARLFTNDGRRLELTARRSRRSFVTELATSTTLTTAQRTDLNRLGLTYDGNASRPGVTVRVRVYDWPARRWRTVATLRNAGRDRTVRWAVTRGASRYVSSRGVVRVSVRGTAAKSFRTRSDLLRLSTR